MNSSPKGRGPYASATCPTSPAPAITQRIGQAVLATWRPIPVATPTLDPQVDQLPTWDRVAEVLRYNLLSLEQALSPRGGLRAWLKLNLLVGAVVVIPGIVVVPAVTFLLSGFADWTTFLRLIAENLMHTVASLMLAVLAVVLGGRLVLALLTKKR